MARLLALCSLPRTNPKNRHEFKRVNGPYTLYMVAGGGNKLPYGTLPRLLLAWVCTEAVRTQSPELILGDWHPACSSSRRPALASRRQNCGSGDTYAAFKRLTAVQVWPRGRT